MDYMAISMLTPSPPGFMTNRGKDKVAENTGFMEERHKERREILYTGNTHESLFEAQPPQVKEPNHSGIQSLLC